MNKIIIFRKEVFIIKKRLFFFDIDETLYSNTNQKVLSQTKKLILKLSQKPNTILGIATGRNFSNLNVIKEILPYFKYLVLMNGALILENNKIISENIIPVNYIEKVLKEISNLSNKNKKIVTSCVSMNKIAFFSDNNSVQKDIMNPWQDKFDICIDNEFYLKEKIFMLNIFGDEKEKIKPFLKTLDYFQVYYWFSHIDLTMKNITKAYGIKQIKEKYHNCELICTGDGSNDLEMLELADIGIVMGNCEFIEVIQKSNLKSPHINDNKIYDFFKENNLC